MHKTAQITQVRLVLFVYYIINGLAATSRILKVAYNY